MSTKYDKDMMDFLMKPENLEYALEIAHHVDEARIELMSKFWKQAKSALQNHLKQSSFKNEWSIEGNEGDYTKSWYSLSILDSSNMYNSKNRLKFALSQEILSSGFCFHAGIFWLREEPKGSDLWNKESVKSLIHDLKEKYVCKQSSWSVAYFKVSDYSDLEDFLVRFNSDNELKVEEVIAGIWSLLETHSHRLQEINLEISH
jgi:hypothetical protein